MTPDAGHCPTCGGRVKRCAVCGELLPAEQFTRAKTTSGLSSSCRRCQKAYRDRPERKARQVEINQAYNKVRPPRRREPTLKQRLAALERQVRDAQATKPDGVDP